MTGHIRFKPIWDRLLEAAVLLLAVAAFFGLASHQIDLPGLHTDEALEVIPVVQLLRGQEVECFKGVCLNLFGLHLPVMIYEYIATVNTYLALPFFALGGINVPMLRLMPIVQSAIALIGLYVLAREWFNRRVAALAVLMLAVNPSFVFWSRQGVFVTSVTIPISLVAVWAWRRWQQNHQARYLYLGCLACGLGISAKILFAWLVAGVVVARMLLNLNRLFEWARTCLRQGAIAAPPIRLPWSQALIGFGLLLVGLLPVIIFNVQTQSTLNYIKQNVSQSSYYQVDNTRIAENLRERIKQLRSVLNGETFWYLSINPYASWRYPSVFLIAVGVAMFALLGRRGEAPDERLPGWIGVAVVVIGGYIALWVWPLHQPTWYGVVLSLGLLSGGLMAWRQHRAGRTAWPVLATAAAAALLFILFAYLAWKLGQWKPGDTVYPFSVLLLLLAAWVGRRDKARRVLEPILIVAGMLSLSVFTPTALWFTHLAILTPWPALIIAAAADMLARSSGLDRLSLDRLSLDVATRGRAAIRPGKYLQGRVGAALSVGLLGMVALSGMLIYDDLEVDAAYHRELKIIKGKGDHTYASYDLARYLIGHDLRHVVAMDFGIQDRVQFLSQGEINPVEIFGHEDRLNVDEAFRIRLREQLADPDTVYVFHATYPIFLNRWEAFEQEVAQQGKTWSEIELVRDPSTIPIFRLVTVH